MVGILAQPPGDIGVRRRIPHRKEEKTQQASAPDDRLGRQREVQSLEQRQRPRDRGGRDEHEARHGGGVALRVLEGEVGAERVPQQREAVQAVRRGPRVQRGEVEVERVVRRGAGEGRARRAAPAEQVDRVHAVRRGEVVEVAVVEGGGHGVAVQEDEVGERRGRRGEGAQWGVRGGRVGLDERRADCGEDVRLGGGEVGERGWAEQTRGETLGFEEEGCVRRGAEEREG